MPVEIFCCYARKDRQLLEDLKTHLMPMQRSGHIMIWADTDIDAGIEWEKEIDKHLNSAQIILLLVSPHFIASEYCYSKEMIHAMQRHEAGEAHVIPIILRSVLWENTPFGKLQVLPTGAKPVIGPLWHNQDEALFDVAFGVQKVVKRFLQEGEQPKQSERDETTIFKTKAVPTGFEDLDRLTGGLQSSDLIIVEAPPGIGKTNFALSISLNIAIKFARSIGIFSLEMPKERLFQRLFSLEASIDLQRIFAEQIYDHEWERFVKATENISKGHIWIDDSSGLTMSQLRMQARKMVLVGKVEIIIVDYVNLIEPETTHKNDLTGQAYREISRGLKGIARELNIPVIALAQISRKVRSFGGEPKVSDAQDNSIENDADVVMYIYREDEEFERPHIFDFIVTKHRNGSLGVISLYCEPQSRRFIDLKTNTVGDS